MLFTMKKKAFEIGVTMALTAAVTGIPKGGLFPKADLQCFQRLLLLYYK